ILGKLSLRELRAHVPSLIKQEIKRAYFYFYHAHTIPKEMEGYDLSILENTLQTGQEAIVDFITQILGIAGSLEDSEILSITLKSKNRKIRAQALETVEKTCDPKIFSLLE